MTRALLFDCDGVLADTERDGHLVAFNRMWREQGVNWQWTVPQYAEALKIGGGKERIANLANDPAFRAVYPVPASKDDWMTVVAGWHKQKTAIFQELVMSGAMPARPGVKRLAEEALAAGWTLAVCSTSALDSVKAVLESVVGAATAKKFAGVFAGDIVKAKKPAPDIYNYAADHLGLQHDHCVVVEDSRNGLQAATAAGMRCVITQNPLTEGENFAEAMIVLTSLGDPGGEQARVVANRSQAHPNGVFTLGDLERVLG